MAAGYSGTPLAKKLGIKDGDRVAILGAPHGFRSTLATTLPTDITADTIREVFLPLGLVDNKVCAIDDTWSGLRVVWRKERRAALRAGR